MELQPYDLLQEPSEEADRFSRASTSPRSFHHALPLAPPPLRSVVSYLQKSSQTAIVTTIAASPETGTERWWWWGGVTAADGCIYYIPGGANRVLKFDPTTGSRELIGPPLKGQTFKGELEWMAGVLGPDTCIYGKLDMIKPS